MALLKPDTNELEYLATVEKDYLLSIGPVCFRGSKHPVGIDGYKQDLISLDQMLADMKTSKKGGDEGDDSLDGLEDAFGNDTPGEGNSNGELLQAPDVVKPTYKSNDVIDYSVCVVSKTEVLRSAWCGDRYDGDAPVLKACKRNFCTFCCEGNIRKAFFCFNGSHES